ncbi:MAG: sortase [Clostridiales bacterium]|nr:sortase [Clostridiales bacterium]
MSTIRKCCGFLLIVAGLCLYLYPTVSTRYLSWKTEGYIRDYDIKWETETGEKEKEVSFEAYYEAIQEYNTLIYEQGQSGFGDAWVFEQAPVELYGFEDGQYGYIEIPAMEISLPLFIGASTENMAKGAAILGQTSIPIGETNSNSVIAGHRGYSGIPYFREIEKLSVGDKIYVTNPWETLTYQVESIEIVDPYDVDAVKIQEGKDMITFLT